jgi:hypothetical protein
MEEPGLPALVDLSGIDLTAPDLQDGSVLGWALARIGWERDMGCWGYASFINDSASRERPAATGGTE